MTSISEWIDDIKNINVSTYLLTIGASLLISIPIGQAYKDYRRYSFGSCEGKIVERKYEPKHTSLTPVTTGKTTIMIPHTNDDEYILTLSKEVEGKAKTLDTYVTKQVYDNTKIGEHISLEKCINDKRELTP